MWSEPSSSGCSAGTSLLQRSSAYGQRVWNGHPGGASAGSGTSPSRMMRSILARGLGTGAADSSASVYGCSGSRKIVSVVPISTMRPRYITPQRSLK